MASETNIPGTPPVSSVLTQDALMRMSPAQRKKYASRLKARMPPVNAMPPPPDMQAANTVLSAPGGY